MHTAEKIIPNYCCIALTESCFLRCRMCYKWQSHIEERDPREPTVAQWRAFIASVREVVPEGFQINYAGGEALTRKETLELIVCTRALGMRAHLASNGYLVDELMAQAIAEAGLDSICLSVDGAQESTHDFMRGTPGAYQRVLKAMALLKQYSPHTRITVNAVICAYNLDELEDLVRWADAHPSIDGIMFQAVTQPFSTPGDELWYTQERYAGLWPQTPQQAHAALDRLIKIKELSERTKLQVSVAQLKVFKRYFSNPHDFLKVARCHIDDKVLNVTPVGDVHICYYQEPVGNVKVDSVLQIMRSERFARVQAMIRTCRKNCQSIVNCNFSEGGNYRVDEE